MSKTGRLALVSAGATFVLISIGGLVRATKSGLGCGTDWPHCSGRLLPAIENRAVLIEFSHRLAAGIVVLLLAGLAISAYRHHRSDRRVLRGAVIALGLVLGQAALGAVVVKLELQAVSVVLHLLVALTLLGVLLWVAWHTLESPPARADEQAHRRALLGAAAVVAAMLTGSYVTGSDAGLAFRDWPLMDGRLIPDLSLRHTAIAFIHRLFVVGGAISVVAAALPLIRFRADAPLLGRLGITALVLFGVEVLIGALNVWTELSAVSVTLHLAVGAALWACLVTVTVATSRYPEPLAARDAERHTIAEAPA